MTKKTAKRNVALQLSVETIRQITVEQLTAVQGGLPPASNPPPTKGSIDGC